MHGALHALKLLLLAHRWLCRSMGVCQRRQGIAMTKLRVHHVCCVGEAHHIQRLGCLRSREQDEDKLAQCATNACTYHLAGAAASVAEGVYRRRSTKWSLGEQSSCVC